MVARALVVVVAAVLSTGPAAVWTQVRQFLDGSFLSIMSGLQPPIIEELLVRGIVWAVLARSFSPGVVLLWSSVLFWSWHLEFGLMSSGMTGAWGALVCGLPRIATGLIWPGSLFHLMGNAGAGQFLIPPVALVAAGFIGWDVVETRSRRARG